MAPAVVPGIVIRNADGMFGQPILADDGGIRPRLSGQPLWASASLRRQQHDLPPRYQSPVEAVISVSHADFGWTAPCVPAVKKGFRMSRSLRFSFPSPYRRYLTSLLVSSA